MNDLVTWMVQDYATKKKIWTFRHKGRLSAGLTVTRRKKGPGWVDEIDRNWINAFDTVQQALEWKIAQSWA